jgi:hypothetical protein
MLSGFIAMKLPGLGTDDVSLKKIASVRQLENFYFIINIVFIIMVLF